LLDDIVRGVESGEDLPPSDLLPHLHADGLHSSAYPEGNLGLRSCLRYA